MTNNLKAVVYGRLEAIMAAEKITRVELGAMSRELLIYVPETHDIDIVNRLINALTPVNRRAAILFFKHFLPWDVENDADGVFAKFGKMHKGEKKVAKKHMARLLGLGGADARAFGEPANLFQRGREAGGIAGVRSARTGSRVSTALP